MKTKISKGDRDALLSSILLDDAWHHEALKTLRETASFAWITGGFVRNAIWDAVFDKEDFCIPADVDVIYLGPRRRISLVEQELSASLIRKAPMISWSVKDQSRMHLRSNDSPYQSLNEALRAFPDRSSAIAVRLLSGNKLEILAPYGLQDAFRGIVRPTSAGRSDERYQAFLDRKLAGWRKRWPHLMVASATPPQRSSHRAA